MSPTLLRAQRAFHSIVGRRSPLTIGSTLVLAIMLLSTFLHMPPARATAAAPTSPVHQAFFYNPPKDMSVSAVAARARFLILGQGIEGYIADLRDANYTGPVMQYMLSNEVMGPGPYRNSSASCNSSYVPWLNNAADQVGDFCRYLHPNESWFLHNGDGARLYGGSSAGTWYHMNPASSGWRSFVRSRVQRRLTSSAYDGLFLDNVALTYTKARSQLSNSDGTIKEYTSSDAYRSATIGYLKYLSDAVRPDKKLWANFISDRNDGTNWNPYMDYLDGGMFEAFATGYNSNGMTAAKWNNNLLQAEAVLASGKGILAVTQGKSGDQARETFALASYLLVTDNRQSYYRHTTGPYTEWEQYANFNVALGAPKGKRVAGDSTWRRDFECGYVVVNPTLLTGQIVPTACESGTATPPPPTPTLEPPTATSEPPTATSTVVPSVRIWLPGIFQVEDYNSGGQQVSYSDTTAGNASGKYRTDDVDIQSCSDPTSTPCYNVGYIAAGEWLTYDVNVASTGDYVFKVRGATPNTSRRVRIEVDGVNVTGSLMLPVTGGYQQWGDTTSGVVRLEAGSHQIRIVAETGSFNLNYVTVAVP